MIKEILKSQLNIKSFISMSVFFIIYLFIYTLLDHFNGGYENMKLNYGFYLPILNVLLNIFMSAMSALMMNLSYYLVKQNGKEGKGTFLSSISVVFGILTYGCTSCVIAFFATIGITFSVAVLPLAGLPYKFISVLLIIIGFFWLIREIKNPKCKIK